MMHRRTGSRVSMQHAGPLTVYLLDHLVQRQFEPKCTLDTHTNVCKGASIRSSFSEKMCLLTRKDKETFCASILRVLQMVKATDDVASDVSSFVIASHEQFLVFVGLGKRSEAEQIRRLDKGGRCEIRRTWISALGAGRGRCYGKRSARYARDLQPHHRRRVYGSLWLCGDYQSVSLTGSLSSMAKNALRLSLPVHNLASLGCCLTESS